MNQNAYSSRKVLLATIACTIVMFVNNGRTQILSMVIPSYMQELGINATQIGLSSTISTIVGFIFSLIGVKLLNRLTPKWALVLSCLFTMISSYLSYIATNLTTIYISSIFGGAVVALGTHAAITGALNPLYGKNLRSVLGVVFGIGTFGGTVALAIGTALAPVHGSRFAYIAFGVIGSVIAMIFAIIFVPRSRVTKSDGTGKQNRSGADHAGEDVQGMTYKEAVRTPAFYILYIAVAISAMLYGGFSMYATSYWQANGIAATTSNLWLTIATFTASIMTFFSGIMAEKLGNKAFIVFVFGGYAAAMGLTLYWSSNPVAAIAMIGIIVIGFIRAANTIPSLTIPEMFGRKDLAAINSGLMSAFYLGAVGIAPVVGGITDLTGSYNISFFVLLVMALVSMALFLVALRMSPAKKGENNNVRIADKECAAN